MKTTWLFLLITLCFSQANAQDKKDKEASGSGVITGKIVDSTTNAPLEYATVSLFKNGSSKPVDGTTSNNSGHFQLLNITSGTYSLVMEFIGYKPVTIPNVAVNEKSNVIDLKAIYLQREVQTLQTVVVTAQGKIIENKIDKMVFNAEKDLTSQTGVATDVLKKVPQVSVDVDGNVDLAGSASVRFLINGKPSSAFGNNIADVLQSIPASQIKSIEVITNPGAKYDAQGIGGIINIILKKNTARGINGNLSVTAGTRMDNGSFNFNARKGKLAFNAFISGNLRPYVITPTIYNRTSVDSAGRKVLLHQDGTGRFKRDGTESGLGFDYTINERNSVTASFAFDHFQNDGSGIVNQTQTITDPASVVSLVNTDNHTQNRFDFHTLDASVNYRRTYSKEDKELNIAANTSIGKNEGSSGNLQFYQPQDSLYYGTNSTNPGKERESEFTLDYANPLKKDIIFGLGGKIQLRDIASTANVLSYEPSLKSFVPNPYLTNNLDYHQKVYAAYSELTFPVAKLFDAKIGGRYERTQINADYSNAQQKVNIPGYNTFVPSLFFSKKLSENQQLKLSYSKRIERPDYRDLNPFINTSDPKNITAGNPYLKPEIGNRFELGYSIDVEKLGSFMVSAFYRTSDQDIQSYVVNYPSLKVGDTAYTNVSVSTRENIGLEKDAGFSFFANLNITGKLNVRTNFFAFHRKTFNTIDPGYNASSFNFRSNINASYQFAPALAAEFFGNFNSARHEVQGIYPSFTSYSIAVRKQLWNKKASIAFTTVNPFSEYVNQETILHGPGFESTSLRKIPFRSFGLNFTWKFGKLEFKKEKENTAPNLGPPE